MTDKIETARLARWKRIFLQTHDKVVTWCHYRVGSTDTEYARIDLFNDLQSRLDKAEARVAELEARE